MGRRFKYGERMMIENSMFYMNFEASSEQQEACIEKIKEAGSDDVNIEPTGVKGSYRVIKKKSKSVDESTEEFKTLNKELELKEMREKVKKCVRETYLELEKILDEEKPSVYGRNKHTYEDVTTLIEYMRKFDFIVEE